MPQDKVKSINPATGELIKEFDTITDQQLEEKIQKAQRAFEEVKNASLQKRAQWMSNLADVLDRNAEKYGRTVTLEMGKTCKFITTKYGLTDYSWRSRGGGQSFCQVCSLVRRKRPTTFEGQEARYSWSCQ